MKKVVVSEELQGYTDKCIDMFNEAHEKELVCTLIEECEEEEDGTSSPPWYYVYCKEGEEVYSFIIQEDTNKEGVVFLTLITGLFECGRVQ